MKAVLISIQPKWCELIASGKKTIEVRKNKPKLETPFNVYIYETQGRTETPFVDEDGHHIFKGRGQVIGEFVCDKVETYHAEDLVGAENADGTIRTEPKPWEFAYWISDEKSTCLPYADILSYGNGKTLYGWHISDLKIYDGPKELREFIVPSYGNGCVNDGKCRGCAFFDSGNGYNVEDDCKAHFDTDDYKPIRKPPQSWCYVEEAKNDL